jgi:predicted cobalt transporter CbtA
MSKRLDLARPRSVILWAVLVGIVAGLFAATFLRIVAEPVIDDAIAIEDARIAAEPHHAADPEQVSRDDQKGAGLFIGWAFLGAAYGLILSITALALRGRWLDPFRRVAVAGTIIAGALVAVPWLKYPPNPPAVGDPATAGERQRLWWFVIILGVLVLAGLAHLSSRLRQADWSDARRIAVVAALGVVAFGLIMVLMPGNPDTIPDEVPAALIWRFRLASLGGNAVLWGLLTVGFGLLCSEAARRPVGAAAAEPAGDQNSMPFRADMPLS